MEITFDVSIESHHKKQKRIESLANHFLLLFLEESINSCTLSQRKDVDFDSDVSDTYGIECWRLYRDRDSSWWCIERKCWRIYTGRDNKTLKADNRGQRSTAGMANLRPVGRMRPASYNFAARIYHWERRFTDFHSRIILFHLYSLRKPLPRYRCAWNECIATRYSRYCITILLLV